LQEQFVLDALVPAAQQVPDLGLYPLAGGVGAEGNAGEKKE
jgi:hypothetical protein